MFRRNRAETYQGKERRSSVRWYGTIPCKVVFFSDVIVPAFPTALSGQVRDLSAKGLRLAVADIEQIGGEGLSYGGIKIGVEINLPAGGKPVRPMGKAVWVKEKQDENDAVMMGIEFSDVSGQDRDAIINHIADYYFTVPKNNA